MCFDLSVYDIFGCLSTGATLVEVPDIHDVYNLAKVIKEEGITIWNSVPAIMEMMLDNTVQEETDFWSMEESSQVNVSLEESSLRLVLLSGDWIPVNLPDRIRKEYENAGSSQPWRSYGSVDLVYLLSDRRSESRMDKHPVWHAVS